MNGTRVAVIGGGTSYGHDRSLASAGAVGEALGSIGYQVVALTIDRTGDWLDAAHRHIGLAGAVEVLGSCAVAVPMLHGPGGEDGAAAALCELAGVAQVGSPARAVALAADRWTTRLVAEAAGLPTPAGTLVTREVPAPAESPNPLYREGRRRPNEPEHLAGMFAAELPLVLRPVSYGHGHGVALARTQEELATAIEVAFALDDRVLIEEVVHGREIDVAVLGSPDGSRMVTPAAQVMARGDGIIDLGTTDDRPARFVVPAPLSDRQSSQLREAAVAIYDALGCAGVARVGFFLTDRGPVLNEVTTGPGFAAGCEVPRMFEAAGIGYPELLALLVEEALAGGPARSGRDAGCSRTQDRAAVPVS